MIRIVFTLQGPLQAPGVKKGLEGDLMDLRCFLDLKGLLGSLSLGDLDLHWEYSEGLVE
jgi:hypothetical protein